MSVAEARKRALLKLHVLLLAHVITAALLSEKAVRPVRASRMSRMTQWACCALTAKGTWLLVHLLAAGLSRCVDTIIQLTTLMLWFYR
jgi:hypothetical protein